MAGGSRTRAAGDPAFRLEVCSRVAAGVAYIGLLEAYLPRARRRIEAPLRELSVGLVGDREMSSLHDRYLAIAGPTDVLTFELEHDAAQRPVAGEVVICVPEARRRAGRGRSSIRHELLLYALHGMLHLCGFDDRTDRGFREMHRLEDEILIELGIGPVFAAGDAPQRRRRGK